MKIKATKTVQVEAKTLSIYMKVCDEFAAQLKDQNGEELKDYEGCVPDFMPDHADGSGHYGDYLILDTKKVVANIGNSETMALEISGADSFEECDRLLSKELATFNLKHGGVRLREVVK